MVVRLRGGLGNQLFCYAAGRSIAIRNQAELVLDTVTDFVDDHAYGRSFALDAFSIAARPASAAERLEPFGYWRRKAARWLARRSPFAQRRYVVADQRGWNPDFRHLPFDGSLTLDGYWQSYRFFQGIEPTLRADLQPSQPAEGLTPAQRAYTGSAADSRPPTVAVHYRSWGNRQPDSLEAIAIAYYKRAIALCEERFSSPQYQLFSDDAELARTRLSFLPRDRTAYASAAGADPTGVSELHAMRRCDHFVIANSTFSWWGAWLGTARGKVVIAPNPDQLHAKSFWRAPELLPPEWTLL